MKKELKKAEKEIEKLSQGVMKNPFEKLTDNSVVKTVIKPFTPDKRKLTLGQRTADWITKWAGSWTFILGFFVFLIFWMFLNTYIWILYLQGEPFDPFPFILLNLILSCLAAIQAPVILMSQNRTNQRDRLRAEYDYQVNRKAEKEIQDILVQLRRVERKLK